MTCSPPVAEETAVNCSMRLSLSLSEAKRFKKENIMMSLYSKKKQLTCWQPHLLIRRERVTHSARVPGAG